jgi:hypothetical protein
MIEGYLVGVIATSSLVAGLLFLRFWRSTRDSLFLAFAASFIIEGLNRSGAVLLDRPQEGSTVMYTVRLFAFLLLLIAIVRKNYESRGSR